MLHHDLSFTDYRARTDCVSNSDLVYMQVAPLLYRFKVMEGNRSPPSKSMSEGTAAHEAILEPESFKKNFVQLPDLDFRLTANKKIRDDLMLANGGKTLLDHDTYERVLGAQRAVFDSPTCMAHLSKCKPEVSFFWEDEDTRIKCKARADALCVEEGFVVDLKTTKDPVNFCNSIGEYGYHRQAAFYIDGLRRLTGRRDWKWYWIAVSMEAPHLVTFWQADASTIELGRTEYKHGLFLLKNARETGRYPGLSEEIRTASLPEWYVRRALTRLQ